MVHYLSPNKSHTKFDISREYGKKKKKVRWEEFGGDQNWGKSKVNIELTSSKVNMNNNISFLKTLDI